MNLPPSPQLLLHCRSPYFSQQIRVNDHNPPDVQNETAYGNTKAYFDLAQMCLNGLNPHIRKSPAYATIMVTGFNQNIQRCIFLGSLASQTHDFSTSIHFYSIAAKRGSVQAMLLLGKLYLEYKESFPKQDSYECALKWLHRAQRMGSEEADLCIGELYHRKNQQNSSFFYFYKYFQKHMTLSVLCNLGLVLQKHKRASAHLALHKFGVAQGYYKSFKAIIGQGVNATYRFPNIMDKFEFFNSDLPIETLDFDIKDNIEIPSFSAAANMLGILEPFKVTTDCKTNTRPINSIQHDSIYRITSEYRNKININFQFRSQLNMTSSHWMNFALHYASEDINQRNVQLVEFACSKIAEISKFEINRSSIFINRSKNGSKKDLFSCGLIYFVLKKYDEALELFQKAVYKGSEEAALLTGILLFHYLHTATDIENACFFFARCTTNVIALLHLGVICQDDNYINRAASIFGVSTSKSHMMLSWLGDIFKDGVMVPRNDEVALMFYAMAYKMCDRNGDNNTDILSKITALDKPD